MVWDSEHGKSHKVSRYVWKVINGDTENPGKVREIVSIHGIYKIDHLELVFSLMKDILSSLREEYPDDYMKIVAFFLNRLIFPLPLKSKNLG